MSIDILSLDGFSRREGIIVREMDTDTVPFAVFEGAIPTTAEIRRIIGRGWGLHLIDLPAEGRDLTFLERFDGHLRHLSIADGSCTDVSPVGGLAQLETLSLYVSQRSPVGFDQLLQLRDYAGPLRHFESVLRLPKIERLELQRVRDGELHAFPESLRYAELVDVQKWERIPPARSSTVLKELYLVGIRTLDLANLPQYSRLEIVGMTQARSLTSVAALAELPILKGIGFDRCRKIEPMPSLLSLDGVEVSVVGANPFDAAFRAAAAASRARWNYYGTARRVPG
jgi:hypothetical protein